MNPFGGSSERRPPRRTVRRSVRRPFGRLALDTSFARHQGQPPQQVTYPYESKTQELTFIAFDDVKASLRPGFEPNSKSEEPLQPGPKRSARLVQNPPQPGLGINEPRQVHSYAAALCETTPMLNQAPLQDTQHFYPSRIQRIRPSPLDLTGDGCSSYQTAAMGIAVTSRFSADTKSPTTAGTRRQSEFHRHGRDLHTPAIVITPAREDFEDTWEEAFSRRPNPRPTSSVYSRYTNVMPRTALSCSTPPVPPLPSFLTPTTSSPRQSKGWWNVITSPFSARSGLSFWRSPSIREEDPEKMPILEDAAAVGMTNSHTGVIFTNRSPDDDDLRSAPASAPHKPASIDSIATPQRSSSAPGVLGLNLQDFNIYDVPIHGEAASYFNPHKNFPSLIMSPGILAESPGDIFDGWSPSQSVAHPDRETFSVIHEIETEESHRHLVDPDIAEKPDENGEGSTSPKSEPVLVPPGPIQTDRGIFSSPAEHELRTVEIPQNRPARTFTHITNDTLMSPLSATPVVEKANIATPFGPQSSFGEQKKVEVTQARVPTPTPTARALGAHTMSHGVDVQDPAEDVLVMKESRPTLHHARQDSYGLGILGTDTDRTGPSLAAPRATPELPQPPTLSEKSALVVDRFGQLQVRSLEDGSVGPVVPWYRRFLWVLVSSAAALVMLIIILLVVYVPQSHKDMPVEAQWLRLSGFPAVPTGVSTIIQPHTTKSRNQCVAPSSLWSCAAPVEQHINQPNFRMEIRFRNGTLPRNETLPVALSRMPSKRDQQSKSLHERRSAWTDYLFSPSPNPPSKDDQEFLGLTTDNASVPYSGEETPFWVSLLDAIALDTAASSHHKRGDSNFTYPYPSSGDQHSSKAALTEAATNIPKPLTKTNGEPTQQLLYPLAAAQPLRLFSRGRDTEHYGFYTYFDRTIYVSINSTGSGNATNTTISNVPLASASAVCTWSQTRLLVQIWTRKHNVSTTSLPSSNNNSSGGGGGVTPPPAANSTANDMQYPGSFPYPVTITVDRHGGDAAEKGVYCYGLDKSSHTVSEDVKTWVAEKRGEGGTLVHAAAVPGSSDGGASSSSSSSSGSGKRDGDGDTSAHATGGIDGGDGGCLCQWQNW